MSYLLYPKKALNNKYNYINTWDLYKERFHEMQPKKNTLQENYNKAKEYYMNLVKTEPYKEILQELKFEEQEGNPYLFLDPMIEKTINKIQADGNLWRFIDKNRKNQPMKISLEEGKKLLQGWNEIIQMAIDKKWETVGVSISRLKTLTQNLQQYIDNNTEIINMNELLGKASDIKATSLALFIQGTLNALRGAVLEEETRRFLIKKLPDDFNAKGGTYITGNITLNGTKIKEDLMTLFDELEIINKEGKVIYRFENGEIVDVDGKKAETINLTEDEYKQLLNASGVGFTAKTSKTTTIFHGGYNINTLLADAGYPQDQIICQLYHMYQLGIENNIDIYQKYAVSKMITYILGKKNVFMVSRNKIIPTYQYVDKLIKTPLRFGNSSVEERNSGDALNTKFGSTNIVGPSFSTI